MLWCAQDRGGNDGVVHGATFVEGKFGKASSFDGIDDYVISTKSVNYPAISVETWMKITSYSESQIVSKWNDFDDNQRGWLLFQISSGKIRFYISSDGIEYPWAEDPVTPTLDTLYHYVGTYDGNAIQLYRNGELVYETPLNGTIFSNQANLLFGIGKETTNYRALNGIIDEVRIYNHALSPGEIKANYKKIKPLPQPSIGVDINITGVPFVGKSTKNIMAADFRNFIK